LLLRSSDTKLLVATGINKIALSREEQFKKNNLLIRQYTTYSVCTVFHLLCKLAMLTSLPQDVAEEQHLFSKHVLYNSDDTSYRSSIFWKYKKCQVFL